MNAQQLFLRYAYSCASIQQDYLKNITQDELDKVKSMALGESAFDDDFVKHRYPVAFGRMQRMMGLTDIVDEERVDAYFLFAHNKAIAERDGHYKQLPDFVCEFCRARVGNIASIKELNGLFWYKVDAYEGQSIPQWVSGEFVGELKKGDMVIVHQAVAVRTIAEEYYLSLKQKYGHILEE